MTGARIAEAGAGAAPPARAQRIPEIDLARSLALLGMVVFHFVYDLELFGLIPAGTIQSGPWPAFARAVAGSFLFLVGVSLWLAHGAGTRLRPFLRRLGLVVAAAAAISLATWLARPDVFVYFGILHAIAAASVVGLAALRLPVWALLAAALACLAAPGLLSGPAFEAPWLLWLGLSPAPRPSVDYVPLLPWLAPCLAGIAAARIAGRAGLWRRLARPAPPTLARLGWPGRHSLAVYLVHQPVLLGLVGLASLVLGRTAP